MTNPITTTTYDRSDDRTNDTATVADPRPAFERAVATTRAVVDAVEAGPADLLDRATPCGDYDVRELLRHLHMALRRAAVVTELAPDEQLPVEDRTLTDADLPAAVRDATREAVAAWVDDDRLTTPMELPWMTAPGAAVLSIYLNETIVHTWDLANAVGLTAEWPDDDLAVALAAIKAQLPEADRTAMWDAAKRDLPQEYLDAVPWSDPFANAVDVADDASAIDRLVAWNGRRP